MPYLLLLTTGLCLAYFLFLFLFPAFFKTQKTEHGKINTLKFLRSLALIILCSLLAYFISESIPDVQLSNRVLHAFGGGFVGFLVCFLAARDRALPITKFQFFIFSALIVTAMGVANELVEFFLQSNFHMVFSPTPTDTWLDLASNTVGIGIAGICFTPFIGNKTI